MQYNYMQTMRIPWRKKMSFLMKVRAVLSVLTDILTAGRAKGWWSKKNEIPK